MSIFDAPQVPFDQRQDLPVLLIDSDTICFRAAAATDGRMYMAGSKAFKYKKDAIVYCQKQEIPLEDITVDYMPEPVSHAIHIVKSAIAGIQRFADHKYTPGGYTMEFFHTGKKNFRHEVIDTYKANRKGSRKPAHLADCKKYVAKKFSERTQEGFEADDLIGIRAYQLKAEGRDYVIVTNDKDLKTIPGKNFNWVTFDFLEVTEEEAMCFFYAQCIAGDDTDNIPGVNGMGINNKGTGKAQKVIGGRYESLIEPDKDSPSLQDIEVALYEEALNVWLDGGPGKKGSYGCESLEFITREFEKSAQCLFILHNETTMWQPPKGEWSNYA